MTIKFTRKPFFNIIALTSLLVPALGMYQPMVNAAQAPTAQAPTVQAKQQLMAQLSKLAFFSANFSQKILNGEGELLQQGSGNLAISKPNLVNWQTITPDETLIVSDGNTLWFYDPFIEQASAFSLAKSIDNTPILLLTSDDPELWQQYTVTQVTQQSDNSSDDSVENNDNGNHLRFIVIPKDDSSQIKKLTLSFSQPKTSQTKPQLSEFSFEDATGQVSQITLSQFNSVVKPKDSLFTFTLPDGVRLEDKR